MEAKKISHESLNDALLKRIPGVQVIYLFGSRAQGASTTDSDYDLAFLSNEPVDREQLFQTNLEIANELDIELDLIDLRSATDVLRMSVLDGGKIIFESSKSLRATFECEAQSDYLKLNERRADIIRDFVANNLTNKGM